MLTSAHYTFHLGGPEAKQFQLDFERVFLPGNPFVGLRVQRRIPGRTGRRPTDRKLLSHQGQV